MCKLHLCVDGNVYVVKPTCFEFVVKNDKMHQIKDARRMKLKKLIFAVFLTAAFPMGPGFSTDDASGNETANSESQQDQMLRSYNASAGYSNKPAVVAPDFQPGEEMQKMLASNTTSQVSPTSEQQAADSTPPTPAAPLPTDSETLNALQQNANAMRANEQSQANRLLGGTSMMLSGIGGMQLMQGMAEKASDEEGAAEMAAYRDTYRCNIGDNGPFNIRDTGEMHIIPGYSATTMSLKNEYTELAMDLRAKKENLGMLPGIESEAILDTSGLYQGGAAGEGIAQRFDTAEERLASGAANTRMIAGGAMLGAGVVGGAVGNALINKDAPQEQSREIRQKYDAEIKKAEADLRTKESRLKELVHENEQKVQKYNEMVKSNLAFIESVCD